MGVNSGAWTAYHAEHVRSSQVFSEVRDAQSLVFYVVSCRILLVFFVPFLFTFVMSVLRIMAFDKPLLSSNLYSFYAHMRYIIGGYQRFYIITNTNLIGVSTYFIWWFLANFRNYSWCWKYILWELVQFDQMTSK